MSFNDFVEAADYAVIEDAYKRAARAISPDLARPYSEYLAKKASKDEDPEDVLIEAHTVVAALGLVLCFRNNRPMVFRLHGRFYNARCGRQARS